LKLRGEPLASAFGRLRASSELSDLSFELVDP